jgi:hypothetical protein
VGARGSPRSCLPDLARWRQGETGSSAHPTSLGLTDLWLRSSAAVSGYDRCMVTPREDPQIPEHRDLAGHELPERVSGDEGLGAGDPEDLAPHEQSPPDSPKKPPTVT